MKWLALLLFVPLAAAVWVQSVEPVLEPLGAPRGSLLEELQVASAPADDFQYQVAALQAKLDGKPAPAPAKPSPKPTRKPTRKPTPKPTKRARKPKPTPKRTHKAKRTPKPTRKVKRTRKPKHTPKGSMRPGLPKPKAAVSMDTLDAMFKEFDALNQKLRHAAPAAAVAAAPAAAASVASTVAAAAPAQAAPTDAVMGSATDVSTAVADPAKVDPHRLSLSPATTPSAVGLAIREKQAVTIVPRAGAPVEEFALSAKTLTPQPWVSARMDLGNSPVLPSNVIMPARLPTSAVAAPMALLQLEETRAERSNEHTLIASSARDIAAAGRPAQVRSEEAAAPMPHLRAAIEQAMQLPEPPQLDRESEALLEELERHGAPGTLGALGLPAQARRLADEHEETNAVVAARHGIDGSLQETDELLQNIASRYH